MARVVVIGAGVGGLAAAGHDVTVCEQSSRIGGKLGWYERDGYGFDTGPSLLTMPGVFEDLFAATGGPLRAELDLRRLDPIASYRFADGTTLAAHADDDAFAAELDERLGAGAGWPTGRRGCSTPPRGRSCPARCAPAGSPGWPGPRPGTSRRSHPAAACAAWAAATCATRACGWCSTATRPTPAPIPDAPRPPSCRSCTPNAASAGGTCRAGCAASARRSHAAPRTAGPGSCSTPGYCG